MRILVINKYIPPDPAPTAVLVADLTRMLREKGAEVAHLGAEVGYRELRPTGWRRWLHEVRILLRLFRMGLTAKRPDCIICLTDPPGVLFIASLLAGLKRTKLVHWAMDVYPDTAAALGEIRAGGVVHTLAGWAMSLGYASCKLIACLDSDMLRHLQLKDDPRGFVSAPWPPIHATLPAKLVPPLPDRIRWLYSGNLGRAHEYETLLQAQRLLEDAGQPFDLIFQGGGNAWAAARSKATELALQHCYWESYAPAEDLIASLLKAHVLIATQRPELRGLLWPSKFALLRLLPRPVVWVGPLDGSIARSLADAGTHHGTFTVGDSHGLAAWLRVHADTFREMAAAPFSVETLRTACVSAAQEEGEKWWSHLTRILPPDVSRGTHLELPLSGKPA